MNFKFWNWKFLSVHIICFLFLLTIPVFFVEFKPSIEMNEKAVFIGLLIGGLSFPLSFLSLFMLSQNNFHLLVLSVSFFLITTFFGWGAANATIGFLANRLYGHEVVKTTEIVSIHDCEGKRKCLCNTEVRLKTDDLMSNGVMCVSEEFWSESQLGDTVLLTGIESIYGFEIYDYERH